MAERVQKTRQGQDETEEVVDDLPESVDTDAADAVEDLLEDIDEILEENAEEFVKSYVQKGGQ